MGHFALLSVSVIDHLEQGRGGVQLLVRGQVLALVHGLIVMYLGGKELADVFLG